MIYRLKKRYTCGAVYDKFTVPSQRMTSLINLHQSAGTPIYTRTTRNSRGLRWDLAV